MNYTLAGEQWTLKLRNGAQIAVVKQGTSPSPSELIVSIYPKYPGDFFMKDPSKMGFNSLPVI